MKVSLEQLLTQRFWSWVLLDQLATHTTYLEFFPCFVYLYSWFMNSFFEILVICSWICCLSIKSFCCYNISYIFQDSDPSAIYGQGDYANPNDFDNVSKVRFSINARFSLFKRCEILISPGISRNCFPHLKSPGILVQVLESPGNLNWAISFQ